MSNAPADDCVLVIFGVSGDLTRRKLLPAVYNLAESGHLPTRFAIVGVAKDEIDDAAFRAQMRRHVREEEGDDLDADIWAPIERHLHYISGEFRAPSTYQRLAETIAAVTSRDGVPPNVLFYLAVPPDLFGPIATHLGAAQLTQQNEGWRRVIVEKPFGYDLETARALNAELASALDESQIYRIDHYLGKETVQNILAFRFANGIFEPIWNRRYVDHVQMTVAEDGGIGTRGAYYDRVGALRDIVQNHMFQLITLVAMEAPISFRAEDVRNEKVKVLHAVTPPSPEDVGRHIVRAQHIASVDGTAVAYRDEPRVDSHSRTETFVAMRLFIDSWRWAGVPFYLRAGKRLPRRVTEIVVQFKRAPLTLFRDTPVETMSPNILVIRIQPEEGVSLSFQAKEPGPFERLGTVTMNFDYAEYFKAEPSTGYETLLFDAMNGDQTLFHRMDMVEASWNIVAPVLAAWRADTTSRLGTYPSGSWGPAEADLLMDRDGRVWRE